MGLKVRGITFSRVIKLLAVNYCILTDIPHLSNEDSNWQAVPNPKLLRLLPVQATAPT